MKQILSVTHHEHVSTRSYEETVAAFDAAVGSIESGFTAEVAAAGDWPAFETGIRAKEGSSGFMRFLTIDHGAWLSRFGPSAKSILYILGNPLIARTMLTHHRGPGLYVPVRLSIYEDDSGSVLVSYDLPSSLMSGFGNADVIAAAKKLDAKLIALAEQVAGAPA